jgi:hypothetical protein
MDTYHRPEWWRRPSAPELAAIANKTGLTIERIRAMTLTGWTQARYDERHRRIGAAGFLHQSVRAAASRPVAMCGRCLASDTRPFIRIEWMIGWVSVCTKHGTVLATHCPHCGVFDHARHQQARRFDKVDASGAKATSMSSAGRFRCDPQLQSVCLE